MKTLLLEGTESSGKTTIARALKQREVRRGFEVINNVGPIDKHSLKVNLPLRFASQSGNSHFSELMYVASLMADKNPQEIYDADLFIQERYFASVMAYSAVLNRAGINRHFGNWLKGKYRKFDNNILIRASIDSRLERIGQRKVKTKLDKMIEANPLISKDIEKAIRRILSPEKNYFEIDTDIMDIEEAVEEIIGRIK